MKTEKKWKLKPIAKTSISIALPYLLVWEAP